MIFTVIWFVSITDNSLTIIWSQVTIPIQQLLLLLLLLYTWYCRQRIGKGTGGLGNKRKNGDHPNYGIIKISQNTGKSPGNLLSLKLHWNTAGVEVGGWAETIQTTALLRTARIQRRVLETWGDLLSLKLHWNTISKRWCGSWRVARDYPNDSTAKNGQNPETGPGDLRRLAVTQTPMKNHQLTVIWKTLKE